MSDYEMNMMKPNNRPAKIGHGNKSAQATCYVPKLIKKPHLEVSP